MAKNLTGRNSKRKNRSRTLGARLDRQRGVYIEGFWSKRSVGIENETKRDSEVEKGQPHAARYMGRVGPPLSFLGSPLHLVFLSHMLISIKNDFRKILCNSEKLSNSKLPSIVLGFLKLHGFSQLPLPVLVNSTPPPFR